eukprot:ctg_956.g468
MRLLSFLNIISLNRVHYENSLRKVSVAAGSIRCNLPFAKRFSALSVGNTKQQGALSQLNFFRRWNPVQQSFFSTEKEGTIDDDSHPDFKPKIKKPPAANIRETIEKQISSSDVVLYMKGLPAAPMCGFSYKVVQILNNIVKYQAYNVLADESLRQGIKEFNWPTIPQLYIKGEFVGGCDIIENMFRTGELQALLASYSKNAQAS